MTSRTRSAKNTRIATANAIATVATLFPQPKGPRRKRPAPNTDRVSTENSGSTQSSDGLEPEESTGLYNRASHEQEGHQAADEGPSNQEMRIPSFHASSSLSLSVIDPEHLQVNSCSAFGNVAPTLEAVKRTVTMTRSCYQPPRTSRGSQR